ASVIPLLGIASAVFIAVLGNVLAARHFERWDWTTSHRFTISPPTRQTIHDLSTPVEIWVILSDDDPLRTSVKELLVAYAAESDKISVHYIDPDRDVVALMDLHGRFGIEAQRLEGRVVADAVAVVASGDRHWFLSPSDLFDVAEESSGAAKSGATYARPHE